MVGIGGVGAQCLTVPPARARASMVRMARGVTTALRRATRAARSVPEPPVVGWRLTAAAAPAEEE
eukprot:COSAG01_NODE_6109_length_3845_cov_11.171116_4_plen_65_part_00